MDALTQSAPERDELLARLQRLPTPALAALLAAVGRLCPQCGRPGATRSSRRTRRGNRVAYLRCGCGAAWKAVCALTTRGDG